MTADIRRIGQYKDEELPADARELAGLQPSPAWVTPYLRHAGHSLLSTWAQSAAA